MFWGLIMEPHKRYTQTVEKSFHVSMASLDLSTAGTTPVQVMLSHEDTNYLLCTLNKASNWQIPLDLNFQEGTTIAFTCNGSGVVHLCGYLIPDQDLDIDELEEEEDEDDDDDDHDDDRVPQLVGKQSKRKAMDSLKEHQIIKRIKKELKTKNSDHDDIELDVINEDDESEDSDELEESMLHEDEGSNDSDEEEDDEDDEDEDENEDEDEVEETKKTVKPQQKDKKNKQAHEQQQQQQQHKKKEDKKKLVNGKETKPEQQTKQQKKNKGEHVEQQISQNIQSVQKKRTVEGGVQIEELKTGSGGPAKPGKFVSVYYVGRLKNGKKFDSTTQGDGFKFRLGKGEVIKGWDVGIAGMKVGGKRRITIPPAMAYGAKGSPPVIPGNSTLIFEVELKNVH